jgi:hypothetical protein
VNREKGTGNVPRAALNSLPSPLPFCALFPVCLRRSVFYLPPPRALNHLVAERFGGPTLVLQVGAALRGALLPRPPSSMMCMLPPHPSAPTHLPLD